MQKKQCYILIGSLSQIFHHFDGITSWLNGVMLVDRLNKESRIASKKKMIKAIELGASVLMFPEGTWNKSPNLLSEKLFPGFYDIAKETGAPIAIIATHREGKFVYGILDEAFDITKYSREEATKLLRDKMSALRLELIEKYSQAKRSEFPYGEKAETYWKKYIDDLMAEVEFYDYEDELHTKYIDKNETTNIEAFAHLDTIVPTHQTAFLFNKRLK